ncbi:DUF4189 domain-containing protein [Kingella potus]|uniref:DUF4189 domain-containing protein n=1 Tax=Kingella potus TaxID=265175 RepID=UPI001FD17391|nr:DUF4189 domain-containing protein [Kingella potus]UOP00846.1 DUF4189 domain-containing protein [Kingella potus]
MLFPKKHLLAAAALSMLLAGCQGSLAYELLQAAKPDTTPSAEQIQSMKPVVQAMQQLPSDAELATRKMQPRKWGSYAGSFPNSPMMWVTDRPFNTPEEAAADALKQCRLEGGEKGGKTCQTVVIYSNLCLAVAKGDKSKPFNALGYGPTHQFATTVALANCQHSGGKNCQVVSAATPLCATPCNLIADSSCRYEKPAYIFPVKTATE